MVHCTSLRCFRRAMNSAMRVFCRRVRQSHLLQHRLETRIVADGIQTRAPDLHRLGNGMICCKVFQSVNCANANELLRSVTNEGEEDVSSSCTTLSRSPGPAMPRTSSSAASGPKLDCACTMACEKRPACASVIVAMV